MYNINNNSNTQSNKNFINYLNKHQTENEMIYLMEYKDNQNYNQNDNLVDNYIYRELFRKLDKRNDIINDITLPYILVTIYTFMIFLTFYVLYIEIIY
jgi:hypothetical protein